MKSLIVYDLDGTLVDTGEDIAQAVNHMLARLSTAPLSLEEIRQYVGRGLHDLIGRCLKTDDPARVEQGVRLFGDYYADHLADHSTLYPGVRDVLEHFKTRAQAVLTNKPHPHAQDLLRALGIADYFLAVLPGGTDYPKKPHPAALQALMGQARVQPAETLLIGDSTIDVATGRSAGVFTVIVSQGFEDPRQLQASSPDVVVRDFEELLGLAKRRGW